MGWLTPALPFMPGSRRALRLPSAAFPPPMSCVSAWLAMALPAQHQVLTALQCLCGSSRAEPDDG